MEEVNVSQNKVNSFADARESYESETDCRSMRGMDTSGNVFESSPAREGPPSALFDHSRNLASLLADWDQVIQEILWNMGYG